MVKKKKKKPNKQIHFSHNFAFSSPHDRANSCKDYKRSSQVKLFAKTVLQQKPCDCSAMSRFPQVSVVCIKDADLFVNTHNVLEVKRANWK